MLSEENGRVEVGEANEGASGTKPECEGEERSVGCLDHVKIPICDPVGERRGERRGGGVGMLPSLPDRGATLTGDVIAFGRSKSLELLATETSCTGLLGILSGSSDRPFLVSFVDVVLDSLSSESLPLDDDELLLEELDGRLPSGAFGRVALGIRGGTGGVFVVMFNEVEIIWALLTFFNCCTITGFGAAGGSCEPSLSGCGLDSVITPCDVTTNVVGCLGRETTSELALLDGLI